MAGKTASPNQNPLVITGRPDTSLNVQLHPLVLLTISDYITRHSIRQQAGPAIGAIIGEQNGRNFTLEVAFECKLTDGNSGQVTLDGDWFSERLEMYKEVHKAPALDLVALFATGPVEGPQPAHLPVLAQAKAAAGSDSIMLLLFHPEQVDRLQGGKLPISLYESVQEEEGNSANMRFKELAYEVETGEAERIGVDFVARGGGAATAVAKAESATAASASTPKDTKAKGKGKGKAKEEEPETNGAAASVLSPEDDELISSLQAKVNAIKMLNERLTLIRTYLTSLPQSYLNDASSTAAAADNTNFTLLRSVNSMLSRLPLLSPPQAQQEAEAIVESSNKQSGGEKEKEDVHLTSLLASLTRSVAEAQNLGSRFSVVQKERISRERAPFGGGRAGRSFNEEGIADTGGF